MLRIFISEINILIPTLSCSSMTHLSLNSCRACVEKGEKVAEEVVLLGKMGSSHS